MPRYKMEVVRATRETFKFEIDTESDIEAHEIAEEEVAGGEVHQASTKGSHVNVMGGHRVRDQ
jgi:hypothetical protein